MRNPLTVHINRLRGSTRYSMELVGFYPVGGLETFLEGFCHYNDERVIDWHETEESGIGSITFWRKEIPVYWSAETMTFCFHCHSAAEASQMRATVIDYFDEFPHALG